MLEPERIEETLEKRFPKGEPEGMRERVLSRARQELRPAKRRVLRGLKLGLACAAVIMILCANISDSARRTRLAAGHPTRPELDARAVVALLERQRMAQESFASGHSWKGEREGL